MKFTTNISVPFRQNIVRHIGISCPLRSFVAKVTRLSTENIEQKKIIFGETFSEVVDQKKVVFEETSVSQYFFPKTIASKPCVSQKS